MGGEEIREDLGGSHVWSGQRRVAWTREGQWLGKRLSDPAWSAGVSEDHASGGEGIRG